MKRGKAATAELESAEAPVASVMAQIGVIGGEVLIALDTVGPSPAHELIDKLDWPPELVLMTLGSLARQRRIDATLKNGEVFVKPAGRRASDNESSRPPNSTSARA